MAQNFDYIGATDYNNAEKRAIIANGPQNGQMIVNAMFRTSAGTHICEMTRYCDRVNVTASWCREFADEVKALIGDAPSIVRITVSSKKAITYSVEKNCLRVFDVNGFDWRPIYENNNGIICRDSVALADCGVGAYNF